MPTELNPNVHMRSLVGDMSSVVDEAILQALESNASDQLLATLAEARGGIVRMNHALSVVTFYTTDEKRPLPEGAKPKALPPIKPQPRDTAHPNVERPGISKLMKGAKDFDCPTRGAEKGTACFKFTSPGGRPTEERRDNDAWMHNKRQQLARDYNIRARAKYDREHFEAKS